MVWVRVRARVWGDRSEEEEEESDADLRLELPVLIGFGPLFTAFMDYTHSLCHSNNK